MAEENLKTLRLCVHLHPEPSFHDDLPGALDEKNQGQIHRADEDRSRFPLSRSQDSPSETFLRFPVVTQNLPGHLHPQSLSMVTFEREHRWTGAGQGADLKGTPENEEPGARVILSFLRRPLCAAPFTVSSDGF